MTPDRYGRDYSDVVYAKYRNEHGQLLEHDYPLVLVIRTVTHH
jgi:hypothetical protein